MKPTVPESRMRETKSADRERGFIFSSQQRSRFLNILVVDDDETMRALLDAALCREGFQVQQASSGKKAYEEISKFKFDMVVMDYDMPDMTGLDTMLRLKAENITLPPTLILSAKGSPDLVKQFIDAGAKDFMVKPFTVPILLDRINRMAGTAKKA